MALINCARIFMFFFFATCISSFREEEWENKLEEQCRQHGRDSFFDSELIVGKKWRIYHSWFMDMKRRCLDVRFKFATQMMIRRFFNDMRDHLVSQPVWASAYLYMTVGKAKHEMLLFPEINGPAGRFAGVPNLMREGYSLPYQTIPVKKLLLKLLDGGKYLLIMECSGLGITYLAAKTDSEPNRVEIDVIASQQGLEDGASACIQDTMVEDGF